MMNKMKSARINLLRFMFILPLVAIVLFAFRYERKIEDKPLQYTRQLPADSVPVMLPNAKNYHLVIYDNNGECVVIVRDKNKKEVERLPLTKWNANESYYTKLYGQIPPPPPPAVTGAPRPERTGLPANMSMVENKDNKVTIYFKDGSVEKYDLANKKERAAFDKKYEGKLIPPPPPAPPLPAFAGTPAMPGEAPIPAAPLPPPGFSAEGMPAPPAPPTGEPATINGETILRMKVRKESSREELDDLTKEAKKKEVDIQFTNVNYNSSNEITKLVGVIEKGNSKSTFSISEFNVVNFLVTKDNEKYSCIVYTNPTKTQ